MKQNINKTNRLTVVIYLLISWWLIPLVPPSPISGRTTCIIVSFSIKENVYHRTNSDAFCKHKLYLESKDHVE